MHRRASLARLLDCVCVPLFRLSRGKEDFAVDTTLVSSQIPASLPFRTHLVERRLCLDENRLIWLGDHSIDARCHGGSMSISMARKMCPRLFVRLTSSTISTLSPPRSFGIACRHVTCVVLDNICFNFPVQWIKHIKKKLRLRNRLHSES
jgi:hypothetical protein